MVSSPWVTIEPALDAAGSACQTAEACWPYYTAPIRIGAWPMHTRFSNMPHDHASATRSSGRAPARRRFAELLQAGGARDALDVAADGEAGGAGRDVDDGGRERDLVGA